MLTDLQKRKLMLTFNAFDHDRDGMLEQQDFEGLAVNLAKAFNVEADSSTYPQLQQTLQEHWQQLHELAGNGQDQVDPESWLRFYDTLFSSPESTSAYLNTYMDGFYALWDLVDPAAAGQGTTLKRFKGMYRAYGLDEAVGEDAFRRMDTNGNGVIDRNEMYQRVMEFYGSDPDAPGNWLLGPYE
ncbi:MAG TPA: hypothetical protein VGD58_10140 [Herpetosiphonaceae bacterium]